MTNTEADYWINEFARNGMHPTGQQSGQPSPAITPASAKPTEAKPPKYRNKKFTIDDWTFDSSKEARRYLDLRAEQQDGRITELRCQEAIPLVINGVTIGNYVADFTYRRNGIRIIEDVKSKITRKLPVYRLKRKILEANGITITEV